MPTLSKLLARPWVKDAALGAVILTATLALLLFPQDAMAAARDGLTLCYNVIIPSLFPFFVLSSLVVELGLAAYLGRALERVMYPLFRVNGACASAFVLGFIGGYPVGAKTAISLYRKGMCSRTEAERLLSFCNNSGPAFILGVVGAGVFGSSRMGLLLYLAHALSSVCVGLLFRFYRAGREGESRGKAPLQFQAKRFTEAFTDSVRESFLSTLSICAFVVFFTVLIRLLFLSGILPALAKALGALLSPFGFSQSRSQQLLTGLLELSSGVWSLTGSGTLAGRLSMAAFMLGWAGLSVHCQVLSFIGGSGLSTRTYLLGKLLHGGLSALFTAGLTALFSPTEPVSSYLVDQVDSLACLDFHTALTISLTTAWLVWLLFFLGASAALSRRSLGRKKQKQ